MRLFEEFDMPLTVYAVAMALERHPEAAAAMVAAGHEIASHGWRWINYHGIDEATEREHMRRAIASIEKITGQRPLGWYTGPHQRTDGAAGGGGGGLSLRRGQLCRRPAVLDQGWRARII